MVLKRIIAGFLFGLLLLFVDNNLPFEVYTSYGHQTVMTKCEPHARFAGLFLRKPTHKTDHIKVRYMGAAGTFQTIPCIPGRVPVRFVLRHEAIRNTVVHPGGDCWSCSLRGPPVHGALKSA